ncbi:MAG TPA: hypothetical protein DEB22_06000, partial [Alcanivorax sp.]|nr:hypothetical protein [Alcanivorax sp.]
MVLETTGGGEDESSDDQPAEETSGDSKPGDSKPGESEPGGSGPAREASSTQDSGGIGEHPAKSGAAAAGRPSRNVHAGPAVRKLARETGVDLGTVPPSGPK